MYFCVARCLRGGFGGEEIENLGPTGHRSARESTGENLGKRRQVRGDAEELLRTTRGDAEAGDDLVEDEDYARLGSRFTQLRQKVRHDWYSTEMPPGGFENNGGDVASRQGRVHGANV